MRRVVVRVVELLLVCGILAAGILLFQELREQRELKESVQELSDQFTGKTPVPEKIVETVEVMEEDPVITEYPQTEEEEKETGQMVNYANIADEIGKDTGTVKSWMSILEASGIIYLLEPYTPAVLKRAIKTPKVYFRDTGLAAYLTRWLTPDTLALGAMAGNIFETYVISEILKSYSNRGIDYRYCVSYYRGKDKKKVQRDGEEVTLDGEIDFIIEENGVLYPIEIKKNTAETADATAAFRVLDKVPNKKRGTGAVISLCPEPGMLRENILELPVWYI